MILYQVCDVTLRKRIGRGVAKFCARQQEREGAMEGSMVLDNDKLVIEIQSGGVSIIPFMFTFFLF